MAKAEVEATLPLYKPLLEGLKALGPQANPKYSDLTIKCGDRSWRVHKAIVILQSGFFAKACEGPFKEAHENVITLEDDDPAVLNALLHFLYTFDFADDTEGDAANNRLAPIVFNVHVSIIADKYGVSSLAMLAARKFAARAEIYWNKLAFADAVELAYISAPDRDGALREAITRIAGEHAWELFEHEYGARFREVAGSVPLLGSELAQKLAGRLHECNAHPMRRSRMFG